jgi:hypothetical protein
MFLKTERIRLLNQFFVEGASGMIRWAIGCPDIIFSEQIRSDMKEADGN